VAQLYLQALSSLLVASYDLQSYGEGILTRLHMDRLYRSRSHITTDSQSASSSRCLAPLGAGDQMLHLFEWQLRSLFFI
jgi:hypothetical protein